VDAAHEHELAWTASQERMIMRHGAIREWAIVLSLAWLGASCGGTDPTGSTLTPTPTPRPPGTAAVVSDFHAEPSSITEGDAFTLLWVADGGTVSLALKGSNPFKVGLPSISSQVLSSTSAGYPAGPGAATYVIMVGDAAVRAETTVTVKPKPTPTPTPEPTNRPPTVSVAASPTTCHPTRSGTTVTPCTSTCTATASDPDNNPPTYSWSGCASGSASTATCSVNALTTFTCSVTVSDTHAATANASATVTGTNQVPAYSYHYWYPESSCNECVYPDRTDAFLEVVSKDDDHDPLRITTYQQLSGPCSNLSTSPTAKLSFKSGPLGETCDFRITIKDSWNEGYTSDFSVAMQN
jgi:hypothetical protein